MQAAHALAGMTIPSMGIICSMDPIGSTSLQDDRESILLSLRLLVQQVHAAEEGTHVRLERIARDSAAFDFFAVRLQYNAA